jgi:hexosaminidase
LPIISEVGGEDVSRLVFAHDETLGPEAYRISVTEEEVQMFAGGAPGWFHAVQTVRQLLPPEIEHTDYGLVRQDIEWTVPRVSIEDQPRFSYRGMHLDIARHFQEVSFVKEYIDLLARHKQNVFHWHLTEDQGWRIEINQYPRLTEVGAYRDETLVGRYGSDRYDGTRYGGFYTQDEVREVVAFAAARGVTVIPEIELPGHASAALAAYPELGCTGGPYKVQTTWGIFEDVYCPTEATFTFLENVLMEVMALFPSKYIHIGGDEVPKSTWEASEAVAALMAREGLADQHEVQSYFVQRIERFLNGYGRQIIGWDEILEGGLAPGATVMSWRGISGGLAAARMEHDVVMTPTSHAYFDYYQAEKEGEPLAIGGFLPLEKVYSYEPIPEELEPEFHQYILGAQGNVWTEYMRSEEKVWYMAFPRALAMAEVGWLQPDRKNFDHFQARAKATLDRLRLRGVTGRAID